MYQLEGIQRYGFHGLSCESIVQQLGKSMPSRMVIAHLGNGASITAVKDGKSIDTSMGFTPTGGVIMGTRSGDMDPGVFLYLLRAKKFDVTELDYLINHRSGLLGISGLSGDMQKLREAAALNADARLAIAMFCYSVHKQISAMVSALNGIDLLVFTGGIGQHQAQVRSDICQGLSWIGVRIIEALNHSVSHSVSQPISSAQSCCKVLVLDSLEDAQIVRHSRRLIGP